MFLNFRGYLPTSSVERRSFVMVNPHLARIFIRKLDKREKRQTRQIITFLFFREFLNLPPGVARCPSLILTKSVETRIMEIDDNKIKKFTTFGSDIW